MTLMKELKKHKWMKKILFLWIENISIIEMSIVPRFNVFAIKIPMTSLTLEQIIQNSYRMTKIEKS